MLQRRKLKDGIVIFVIKHLLLKKKSKHFYLKTHKQKGKFVIVVKEYEIFWAKFDEIDYALDNIFKECRGNFFMQLNINVFLKIKLQLLQIINKLN